MPSFEARRHGEDGSPVSLSSPHLPQTAGEPSSAAEYGGTFSRREKGKMRGTVAHGPRERLSGGETRVHPAAFLAGGVGGLPTAGRIWKRTHAENPQRVH